MGSKQSSYEFYSTSDDFNNEMARRREIDDKRRQAQIEYENSWYYVNDSLKRYLSYESRLQLSWMTHDVSILKKVRYVCQQYPQYPHTNGEFIIEAEKDGFYVTHRKVCYDSQFSQHEEKKRILFIPIEKENSTEMKS